MSWSSDSGNGRERDGHGRYRARNKYGVGEVESFRAEPELRAAVTLYHESHPDRVTARSDALRELIDNGLRWAIEHADVDNASLRRYLRQRDFERAAAEVEADMNAVETIRAALNMLRLRGANGEYERLLNEARAMLDDLRADSAREDLRSLLDSLLPRT